MELHGNTFKKETTPVGAAAPTRQSQKEFSHGKPNLPPRQSAASTLQNHRHRPSYPSYHAARTTMVTGQHPSRELRQRA